MSSNDDNTDYNPLAEQLADLDIDVAETDENGDGDEQQPEHTRPDQQLSDEELFRQAMKNMDPDAIAESTEPAGGAEPPPRRQKSCPPHEDESGEIKTDRQLFEEAVDGIDPAEVYEAKFKGRMGTGEVLEDDRDRTSDPQRPAGDAEHRNADESKARQQVQNLRDEAMFHKAVGDVKPLDNRDKYHQRRRRRTVVSDDDTGDERSLLTPSLPTEGEGLHYIPPPGKAQQAMMQRFERWERSHQVPKLVVRTMTRNEAVDELSAFIDRHHGGETRFVEVVPGRGLRSDTKPVLKPAVIEWLEGPGRKMIRGYVPRRLRGGDYGSLIVEIVTG